MKRLGYLTFLLILFLVPSGCKTSEGVSTTQTPSLSMREPIDYLKVGNELLAKGRLSDAEDVFRKAVTYEPDNPVFQIRLALALILQHKYREADSLIGAVLARAPQDLGALWYRSFSRFEEGRYNEAIDGFRELLPRFKPDQPQFPTANWLIATSYRRRLPEDGLSFAEVVLMVQHYELYLTTAGSSAEDREQIQQFLEWVNKERPPSNVKRWVVVPSEEDILKFLQKNPD